MAIGEENRGDEASRGAPGIDDKRYPIDQLLIVDIGVIRAIRIKLKLAMFFSSHGTDSFPALNCGWRSLAVPPSVTYASSSRGR